MRSDFAVANHLRIEHQRLQPLHVGFVDLSAERRDLALSILWKRCERFRSDRVHLRDDPAGVRLDHLRAVVEVNFVAVVVRRIVARGDDDAGARACRCRTAKESSGVERGPSKTQASQPFSAATFAASSANSCEKKRVSCAITIFGSPTVCCASIPIVQISNEPLRRAADVEEIHRVRADARKLRRLVRVARVPALRLRDDFADRASAQSAGAESERLVEAIV